MKKLLYFALSVVATSAQLADEVLLRKWSLQLPTIEIEGNKFFNSETGEQFFMKGIAYQQQVDQDSELYDGTPYVDPLADPHICLRDLPYLVELGINTIRVYHIDPSSSHDTCMKAFSDAGIYVLIDLAEPEISIVRNNPSWDVKVWSRYRDVVDAMHFYNNVLGFFAGNEVTNDKYNTDASPFVKAAIRDVKSYMQQKGYRNIPVGYSTNDDAETRINLSKYFVCGENSADFYGINMYEWCGYSTYGTSGYKERTEEFTDFPVPVFFSEFGCNLVRPRPFTEVAALFSKKMSSVWSGGLVYMYFEEENQYGVVKINKNNEVEKLPDFDNLKKAYRKATPKGVNLSDQAISRKSINVRKLDCPEKSHNNNWLASDILPPTPNDEKCACLDEILPCLALPSNDDQDYYKTLFNYVCGEVDCKDIKTDGTLGKYGKFSDCSVNQKLSLQLSKLYYKLKLEDHICPTNPKYVRFNSAIITRKDTCESILKEISQGTAKTKKEPINEIVTSVPAEDGMISSTANTLSGTKILVIIVLNTLVVLLIAY